MTKKGNFGEQKVTNILQKKDIKKRSMLNAALKQFN